MKSVIIFLFAVSSAFVSIAQQAAFSNVSIDNNRNEETISFTIPREVNVKYYRVEASNDNITFEVINRVQPQGNTMFAKTYTYNVTAHNYKYYRIGKVQMNGELPYSAVISAKKEAPQYQDIPNNNQTPVVVAQ